MISLKRSSFERKRFSSNLSRILRIVSRILMRWYRRLNSHELGLVNILIVLLGFKSSPKRLGFEFIKFILVVYYL